MTTGRPVPARPQLEPWYRLARGDGLLALEYGQSAVFFEGAAAERLLPALLPLLDGTRTVAEIVRCLGEAVEPAVAKALSLLARHGLLAPGPPLPAATPRPFAETASLLAADGAAPSPAKALSALRRGRAAVVGTGTLAEEVVRVLRLSGVADLERLGWESPTLRMPLALVAPSPAELPELPAWNERALAAGASWLQVLPFDGRYAAAGPLYIPGETCCYACFRLRRADNLDLLRELPHLDDVPARYPCAPALERALAGLAAALALRWLVARDPSLPGVLHALEWGERVAVTTHVVYRVPRCPACSPAAAASAPRPWHEGAIPAAA